MVKDLDKIIPPIEIRSENLSADTDTDTEQAARDEERNLQKELSKKRKLREFSEESWFYWLRVVAAGFTAIVAIIVVTIYWLHILAPECCRWLASDDLNRIERMTATIIVGIVATLSVSFLLKKR